MRVISQNGMHSVNFDIVSFHKRLDTIVCMIDGQQFLFGAYESPERAEEVFLDIHNAYAPVGIITTNLNEAQVEPFIGSENVRMSVVQMDMPDSGITTYDNYVYWMPEK